MRPLGSELEGRYVMQLIDANIFLEIELKQNRFQHCKDYLNKVRNGEIKAITTNFIVDTISILMDNTGCDPTQIRTFNLSLLRYKGLSIYNLTMTDRVSATEHMKKFKLDFDDATAYAAMTATGISEIVSMDRHFDKIPEIKRTEP
jgi:predicted nucleic acid-binding protein